MEEELHMTFDPSRDEVLGVFGDKVHVRGGDSEYVMIMTKKTYLKVWDNWLKGKQNHCERYDEYCGVGGYTVPIKIVKTDLKITLCLCEDDESDEDGCKIVEKEVDAYYVVKFDELHDFEHG